MTSSLIRPLLGLLTVGLAMTATNILTSSRPTTRTGTAQATDTDPRQRGEDYEDHVLDDSQLPRLVTRSRGTLRHHPRISPPRLRVTARYFQSPHGYDGGALPDAYPHRNAARRWSTTVRADYRVPDAIATFGSHEVLHEFKCPNPWLVFAEGLVWVAKMQARFGSQATAYFAWAADRPESREVAYGFCGLAPPWARAILDDLKLRFPLARVQVEEGYFAEGFEPAARMMHRAAREAMLSSMEAPTDAVDAAYDRLKD